MGDLKSFYDYADVVEGIPNGTYHLRVTSAQMGEWDDGRTRLDFNTEVVSGEHAGDYGPRHTWTEPQDFEGVSRQGRAFTSTATKQAERMKPQISKVMGAYELELTNPTGWDDQMFEEIGKQIVGKEFFGKVRNDENGYGKITSIFSLASPPKGVTAGGSGAFSVDEL